MGDSVGVYVYVMCVYVHTCGGRMEPTDHRNHMYIRVQAAERDVRGAEAKAAALRPKMYELAQALQDQDRVRREIEVRFRLWVMGVGGVFIPLVLVTHLC